MAASTEKARRGWRLALTALEGFVALGFLVRAAGALRAGDSAEADAQLAALCVFVAGLLGGGLIEGLRHAPRSVGQLWRRRGS